MLAAMAAALAVLLALSGCGIAPESSPRVIAPPGGLNDALSSVAPVSPESGRVRETLYLVKDGKLVAVERGVRVEPTVNDLILDLLAGPTSAERRQGLTSALLGPNLLASVTLVDGLAAVELAAGFDEISRTDNVLAFAQVVCTLTARTDVHGIYFTRNTQRIGVPRADGLLSEDPVSAADYADLIAR
jgi:spore germination protein GerM